MTDPLDVLIATARGLVAFHFLWSAWFNIMRFQANVDELAAAGVVRGAPLLVGGGTTLMTIASFLFLYPPTVVAGAIGLIAFTLTADALFHRWWIQDDPKDRVLHQQFAFEHLALNAGIVGLTIATIQLR